MVGAILSGEKVDFTVDGVTHPITFANTDFGYINLEDRLPIHVGGFGPRAQALAGKLGDGLITGLPRGGTILRSLANVRRGAERAGRTLTILRFMRWLICYCSSLAELLIRNASFGRLAPVSW